MFRRVIAPALIAVGVWCGVTLVSTLPPVLARRAIDSVAAGQAGNWPLVPSVYWLLPPTLFLAAHLCASRGGTRRECILVAISPLVVAGPLLLVMIFQQAGTSVFSLGFGVGPVVRGDVTLGTVVMARAYMEHLLGLAGTCLAAIWLYFFAVRHMQERPFWLAAEESQTQVT